MKCKICKIGYVKEIPRYRNGSLTRVKCLKCRIHNIVLVSELENIITIGENKQL